MTRLLVSLLVICVLGAATGWTAPTAGGEPQDSKEEASQVAQAPQASPVAKEKAEAPAPDRAALLDPRGPEMNRQAPDVFRVRFETSRGDFVIEVTRGLSPLGADRFYNLVKNGFYDDVRFFRVISGFMAQFGINGDPKIARAWINAGIKDEPVKASNTRGMVSYAKRNSPNSRTTQLFINYKDNKNLDGHGFSPFGKVIEGMAVVDSLYAGYGEGAPRGRGPEQGRLQAEGNAYLKKSFAKLDYIIKARVIDEGNDADPGEGDDPGDDEG
jgi:peptidyl-prolyl cis-trans isomerase A (cyclophilin A)